MSAKRAVQADEMYLEGVFEVVDVEVRAVAVVRALRVQQLVRGHAERPEVAGDAVDVLFSKDLTGSDKQRVGGEKGEKGRKRGGRGQISNNRE